MWQFFIKTKEIPVKKVLKVSQIHRSFNHTRRFIFGQSIIGLISLMHGPDVFLPLNLTEQLN